MGNDILFVIIGMSIVTYLPRFLPLYFLTRIKIPTFLVKWLSFVPIVVLSTLIAPGILYQENQLLLSWQNDYLLAAIPTFLVAVKTKNMILTVMVGIFSAIALSFR